MLPTFNVPPIGPRQGKVWGDTQLVLAHNSVECHVLRVLKGGFSSRHKHIFKWNRFVVLSGSISVRVFHSGDSIDETILKAGQVTDVPPGVEHEFEAIEQSDVLEMYWVLLDASDIDRNGRTGGRK